MDQNKSFLKKSVLSSSDGVTFNEVYFKFIPLLTFYFKRKVNYQRLKRKIIQS